MNALANQYFALAMLISFISGSTAAPAAGAMAPVLSTKDANRCAVPEPGGKKPVGGSNIKDPDATTVDTYEKCAKHCVDNLQQVEDTTAKACVLAVFDTAPAIGDIKCILYSEADLSTTSNLLATQTLIKIVTTCAAATTPASVAPANTSPASVAAIANTTPAATASNTTAAANTTGPLDSHYNCSCWAKDGECDRNPFYMKVACPVSCGTPTATVENANTIPSNVNTAALVCNATGGATNGSSGGSSGNCTDKDATKCAAWAAEEECDKNPYNMRIHCAKSCNSCTVDGKPVTLKNACGDTDVPPIAGCTNSRDECNYWATLGECTTNSEWMPTGCCAACRNLSQLMQKCPKAGNAPFKSTP